MTHPYPLSHKYNRVPRLRGGNENNEGRRVRSLGTPVLSESGYIPPVYCRPRGLVVWQSRYQIRQYNAPIELELRDVCTLSLDDCSYLQMPKQSLLNRTAYMYCVRVSEPTPIVNGVATYNLVCYQNNERVYTYIQYAT